MGMRMEVRRCGPREMVNVDRGVDYRHGMNHRARMAREARSAKNQIRLTQAHDVHKLVNELIALYKIASLFF